MKAQVGCAPGYRLRQRNVVYFDVAFMNRNLSEAADPVQDMGRFRVGLMLLRRSQEEGVGVTGLPVFLAGRVRTLIFCPKVAESPRF